MLPQLKKESVKPKTSYSKKTTPNDSNYLSDLGTSPTYWSIPLCLKHTNHASEVASDLMFCKTDHPCTMEHVVLQGRLVLYSVQCTTTTGTETTQPPNYQKRQI